jgi:hypothetical protein
VSFSTLTLNTPSTDIYAWHYQILCNITEPALIWHSAAVPQLGGRRWGARKAERQEDCSSKNLGYFSVSCKDTAPPTAPLVEEEIPCSWCLRAARRLRARSLPLKLPFLCCRPQIQEQKCLDALRREQLGLTTTFNN